MEEQVKQTKKELFWEIFRFLLVGGTATVFDYAVTVKRDDESVYE